MNKKELTETVKRSKGKKADYILYYRSNLPIVIVEAKDYKHRVSDGMQQVSWKVSLKTLKENNFDLDIKNPNRKEEIIEHTSAELIKKLEDSFVESQRLLKEIIKEL